LSHIYRDSIRFFVATFPLPLGIGAFIEILLWVLQPRSDTASSVALILLAYYFHRHFLFGEAFTFRGHKPAEGAPPFRLGWFILISVAMILLPVAIALALTFGMVADHSHGTLLLFLFPTYLLALGLFGTTLPAAVARDGTYRLSQGLRVALPTMGKLVLGPGVAGLILLVATLAAAYALSALGVAENSPALLALNIATRTLGFLTTILAVAVLCDMYRRTRPDAHSV
jgi:hypothetical protein